MAKCCSETQQGTACVQAQEQSSAPFTFERGLNSGTRCELWCFRGLTTCVHVKISHHLCLDTRTRQRQLTASSVPMEKMARRDSQIHDSMAMTTGPKRLRQVSHIFRRRKQPYTSSYLLDALAGRTDDGEQDGQEADSGKKAERCHNGERLKWSEGGRAGLLRPGW